jgi:hypothetical protein
VHTYRHYQPETRDPTRRASGAVRDAIQTTQRPATHHNTCSVCTRRYPSHTKHITSKGTECTHNDLPDTARYYQPNTSHTRQDAYAGKARTCTMLPYKCSPKIPQCRSPGQMQAQNRRNARKQGKLRTNFTIPMAVAPQHNRNQHIRTASKAGA